ncbi:hypothetical protein WA1_27215 [Scytonema hofmannii PCC 7110]|uniref:CHAT domain-containing protein n=1 Tax=Scytonema hofmannii PCC 7110 TaxID=128403 RepID=A0A139X697_9CYAN|nr:CHAT domain-containing protein [Scytonema hofmannii]KYC40229.1 hypothetical protein WA1_27215 [Scytonema hofmannii PCC 7110]
MEPLLKPRFPQLHRLFAQKIKYRAITILLLFLLGLILVLGIQQLSVERVIGKESQTIELICSRTPNLAPEVLSKNGRISYDRGQFDDARDCWRRAVTAYREQGNETETINNQINQAQAEQALGFYPKACNTLLQIFSDKDCTTLREKPQELGDNKQNSQQLKEENKQKQQREFFDSLAEKSTDSSAKLIGLRSLGNVLRGLGELDLSNYVLLLSLQKVKPEEVMATWLDVGNIRRALSNKEQDLYSRSGDRQHIVCTIVDAYAAIDAYEYAIKKADLKSALQIAIQTRLNRLSFLSDLKDWRQKINQESKVKNIQESQDKDVFNRVFRRNTLSLVNQQRNCWKNLLIPELKLQFDSNIPATRLLSPTELYNWLSQQLSEQNPIIQSQEIDDLRQQIEKLPRSHTTLYTRLNFAKNWMRLQNLTEEQYQKLEKFLNETIDEAQGKPDKQLRNLRAESYALGYLGKLYESRKQWDLARTKTQKALLIAQSIPAQEIAYLWQWQLGRIYKPESTQSRQVKANEIQNNLKNIKEAREAYKGAFETLQFLRRELASGNPDAQLSFLEEIETVYREYVDLLLSKQNPEQTHLSQARTVITSLQAVELENFLRLACPENNLQTIDNVLDKKAKDTAFVYPLVLEDRIEVILKVPNVKQLLSFKKYVERKKVEYLVTQLQLDLEEEYTFEAVRQEAKQLYDWLMKDVDEYIDKNYKNIKTLVFALDTNLRNIPLAALVSNYNNEASNKEVEYLIDKYAIALAPRLDIPYPDVLQGKKLKILAAGLDKPDQKVNELRKFSTLRYANEELDVLNNLEKSNSRLSVTKLSNDKFKTKEFQNEINTFAFQIFHLATHGEFSSSPENTFILAYDQIISIKELGDVFRTQLQSQLEPIELLVLSACETAAGDKRATLGISGVGVRAGARSAIASLWTLDDEISVDFTKIFYRQFIDPKVKTKAQALQQAQKVLKELPGREHPRYWASYILLGNWL